MKPQVSVLGAMQAGGFGSPPPAYGSVMRHADRLLDELGLSSERRGSAQAPQAPSAIAGAWRGGLGGAAALGLSSSLEGGLESASWGSGPAQRLSSRRAREPLTAESSGRDWQPAATPAPAPLPRSPKASARGPEDVFGGPVLPPALNSSPKDALQSARERAAERAVVSMREQAQLWERHSASLQGKVDACEAQLQRETLELRAKVVALEESAYKERMASQAELARARRVQDEEVAHAAQDAEIARHQARQLQLVSEREQEEFHVRLEEEQRRLARTYGVDQQKSRLYQEALESRLGDLEHELGVQRRSLSRLVDVETELAVSKGAAAKAAQLEDELVAARALHNSTESQLREMSDSWLEAEQRSGELRERVESELEASREALADAHSEEHSLRSTVQEIRLQQELDAESSAAHLLREEGALEALKAELVEWRAEAAQEGAVFQAAIEQSRGPAVQRPLPLWPVGLLQPQGTSEGSAAGATAGASARPPLTSEGGRSGEDLAGSAAAGSAPPPSGALGGSGAPPSPTLGPHAGAAPTAGPSLAPTPAFSGSPGECGGSARASAAPAGSPPQPSGSAVSASALAVSGAGGSQAGSAAGSAPNSARRAAPQPPFFNMTASAGALATFGAGSNERAGTQRCGISPRRQGAGRLPSIPESRSTGRPVPEADKIAAGPAALPTAGPDDCTAGSAAHASGEELTLARRPGSSAAAQAGSDVAWGGGSPGILTPSAPGRAVAGAAASPTPPDVVFSPPLTPPASVRGSVLRAGAATPSGSAAGGRAGTPRLSVDVATHAALESECAVEREAAQQSLLRTESLEARCAAEEEAAQQSLLLVEDLEFQCTMENETAQQALLLVEDLQSRCGTELEEWEARCGEERGDAERAFLLCEEWQQRAQDEETAVELGRQEEAEHFAALLAMQESELAWSQRSEFLENEVIEASKQEAVHSAMLEDTKGEAERLRRQAAQLEEKISLDGERHDIELKCLRSDQEAARQRMTSLELQLQRAEASREQGAEALAALRQEREALAQAERNVEDWRLQGMHWRGELQQAIAERDRLQTTSNELRQENLRLSASSALAGAPSGNPTGGAMGAMASPEVTASPFATVAGTPPALRAGRLDFSSLTPPRTASAGSPPAGGLGPQERAKSMPFLRIPPASGVASSIARGSGGGSVCATPAGGTSAFGEVALGALSSATVGGGTFGTAGDCTCAGGCRASRPSSPGASAVAAAAPRFAPASRNGRQMSPATSLQSATPQPRAGAASVGAQLEQILSRRSSLAGGASLQTLSPPAQKPLQRP